MTTMVISDTNPEARIETMVHELAYERVKESCLFQVLPNAGVDEKADELAAWIASLVDDWITNEVATTEIENKRKRRQ